MPLYLFSLLAVPKWVLKAIWNLQHNFLWGSSGLNRKWALIKWGKVCLPKKAGGIGIRDPEHNNRVMGAKLWWRWLAHPNTPWASLWIVKYTSNNPIEDRIRMTELSSGSIIWNSAIQHRYLIQLHSFWEIKNGETARLWDDSWKWKRIDHILRGEEYEATRSQLVDEFKKRQILIAAGADILRWGYEEKGIFLAREAYKIITKDKITKDKIWDRIWSPSLWPKVSTFLWLLSHNRILTWDNLRKRSFSGPSICPNCKQAEETANHLLQMCPWGRKLWGKAIFQCQRDDRVQGDLNATLRNWNQAPYHSKLLNSLWQLIPGLLMWNLWKERNIRLFKGQHQTLEQIWTILLNNIKESLSIHTWAAEEFPTKPQEKSIWDNWQISLSPSPNASKRLPTKLKKPTVWSPPTRNVFKLNFDGASKGNPGQSRYVGAFRDYHGTPHLIYTSTKGWDTNNLAELEGLWQGLLLEKDHNLFPLIIEGDSQILINMATKLLQGA
eukprot:PITA_02816